MSTDLEEAIAASMRPHGDGVIDVEALRTASVRRGRGIRRRRLVVAAGGLAVLAVGTLAIVPVLQNDGGERPGGMGGRMLTLPPADVPGAAEKPESVGTDPTVLHFDVDTTGMEAGGAYWSVGGGVESVRLWTADFDHFNHEYRLARDPASLGSVASGDPTPQPARTERVSVGGRPATATFWPMYVSVNKKPDVPTWSIEWQPADGLYARVQAFTPDLADIIADAEALMLDRSQRCVAPMRLDPAPAGFTVVECGIDLGHIFPWTVSDVTLERDDGVRFDLGIGRISLGDDQPFQPNQLIGDRPAMLSRYPAGSEHGQGTALYIPVGNDVALDLRGGYRSSFAGGVEHRNPVDVTDDEILAIARATTIGPNFNKPDTWPTKTIG